LGYIYTLKNIMNRRTVIKSTLALGVLAASSFPMFKWLSLNKTPDLGLLQSKKDLISELAEMIIPATDTPGAKEAEVAEFIIKIITNCVGIKDKNIFIDGLLDVENYSQNHFGKTFENCLLDERTQILTHFEDKAYWSNNLMNKIQNKFLGQPFFSRLKELTVLGYCTSELGATKGLAYDYIPGKFESCIKLSPQQKSWATK